MPCGVGVDPRSVWINVQSSGGSECPCRVHLSEPNFWEVSHLQS
jgi:hypothetical protein